MAIKREFQLTAGCRNSVNIKASCCILCRKQGQRWAIEDQTEAILCSSPFLQQMCAHRESMAQGHPCSLGWR